MGKLEQLISSLSMNEKAYFKRWIPSTDKQKKFVKVYQIIEKYPTVSTAQLLGKLGKDITPKKLDAFKPYLWSSLLLSLRDYHRKNEFQLQFNSRTDGIKILRSKGLLDAGLSSAQKLLADCEEIEMFPEAIRALEHIENIYAAQGLPINDSEAIWVEIYERKERICLHLAEGSQIRAFERRMKLLNDQLGISLSSDEHKQSMTKLLAQMNKAGISEDACFDVRFRYFSVQAVIARIFDKRVYEQQWFKKVFVLLEENPTMTTTYYSRFYMVALHNYVDALLFSKKFTDIPNLLTLMAARLGKAPATAGRDFYLYANNTMVFHTLTEDYQGGLRKWNKFEQGLTDHEILQQDAFVRLMTLGSVLCFWNKEYKRALSNLRALFSSIENTEEYQLAGIARMLEVLCNYELGDIEHTEHLVGCYLRKETASGVVGKMETVVIQAISSQLKTKENTSNNWSSLTRDLQVLSEAPNEKDKLLTFDMMKYTKEQSSKIK
jgi:hypothetical protein